MRLQNYFLNFSILFYRKKFPQMSFPAVCDIPSGRFIVCPTKSLITSRCANASCRRESLFDLRNKDLMKMRAWMTLLMLSQVHFYFHKGNWFPQTVLLKMRRIDIATRYVPFSHMTHMIWAIWYGRYTVQLLYLSTLLTHLLTYRWRKSKARRRNHLRWWRDWTS